MTDANTIEVASEDDLWCDCCSAGNHTSKCTCGGVIKCCHPLHHESYEIGHAAWLADFYKRYPPDVEPFDTHRQIDCIRSSGSKDVFRCVDCGRTQVEIGVRLPNGQLDRPSVTGKLATVVCPAWKGGER